MSESHQLAKIIVGYIMPDCHSLYVNNYVQSSLFLGFNAITDVEGLKYIKPSVEKLSKNKLKVIQDYILRKVIRQKNSNERTNHGQETTQT